MSPGVWALVIYVAVGWPVATALWVIDALPMARRERWRWPDWLCWLLPIISVPGWILTALWPIELAEWLTDKGDGKHRA